MERLAGAVLDVSLNRRERERRMPLEIQFLWYLHGRLTPAAVTATKLNYLSPMFPLDRRKREG